MDQAQAVEVVEAVVLGASTTFVRPCLLLGRAVRVVAAAEYLDTRL